MKTRIISAIVAIPLLLFFIIYGGYPLKLATVIISLIGMFELYKAVSGKIKPVHIVGFVMEIIYTGCFFSIILNPSEKFLPCVLILSASAITLFLVLLAILVFDHKNSNINDGTITVFAFIYIGVLLSLIAYIRDEGMFYAWMPFIFAFVCDTGAYFAGSFLGKHKLTPELSPKKTIEGSIGGILAVVIFIAVYVYIYSRFYELNNSILRYVIAGIIGSVLSQIGDLAASSIKRFTGIKDYGNIMPGHGGVLDRFDSVIFTTPVVFALVIVDKILI